MPMPPIVAAPALTSRHTLAAVADLAAVASLVEVASQEEVEAQVVADFPNYHKSQGDMVSLWDFLRIFARRLQTTEYEKTDCFPFCIDYDAECLCY